MHDIQRVFALRTTETWNKKIFRRDEYVDGTSDASFDTYVVYVCTLFPHLRSVTARRWKCRTRTSVEWATDAALRTCISSRFGFMFIFIKHFFCNQQTLELYGQRLKNCPVAIVFLRSPQRNAPSLTLGLTCTRVLRCLPETFPQPHPLDNLYRLYFHLCICATLCPVIYLSKHREKKNLSRPLSSGY